jgi:hypothetical protein
MLARLPARTFEWFQNTPMADIFSQEDVPPAIPTGARSRQEVALFVQEFDSRCILVASEYRGSTAERYVKDHFGSLALSTEAIDGFELVRIKRVAP